MQFEKIKIIVLSNAQSKSNRKMEGVGIFKVDISGRQSTQILDICGSKPACVFKRQQEPLEHIISKTWNTCIDRVG